MNVLKTIDADSHILEPPTMWLDYIDLKFREKAPRLIETDAGEKFWFSDECDIGNLGTFGAMGARDGEFDGNPQALYRRKIGPVNKYADGRRGGFDPHARILDMDKEGIDGTFLYPTVGLFMDLVTDEAQSCANARAYNRGLADYCSAYPSRLYGVGVLPMQSVQGALDELRHCGEKLGFRSVFIRPNPYNGRPLHHKDFYPVWSLAQELGVAIGIHGGAGKVVNLGEDRFPAAQGFAVEHCVVHTFEMMAAAASFIMCGICESFPKLRVAFLEAGGGWMLGWLERMDRHVEDQAMNDTNLTCLPSEIFQRQCFVSFEPTERSLAVLAEPLGPTNILWSSDYPHPDGFWGAVKMFKRMGLKPDIEEAVLSGGAKRLYGMS